MFNKNKQPIITFNNTYPKLVDVFPDPEPASKNLPTWYKQQPAYHQNNKDVINGVQQLTIKKCTAFFDGLIMGYVLKCPVDIAIDTTGDEPQFSISQQFNNLRYPLIGNHAMQQLSHYPFDEDVDTKHVLRINMIWVVKTSPGYSTLFIDPQHKDLSPVKAVSAVIDTDTFYSDGLFSFVVKKGYKGVLKKGTPLVQVIPFRRDSWNHVVNKNFDVTSELRHQRNKIRTVFNGGYKKYFWHKKEYR